jgi:hypothetical protein
MRRDRTRVDDLHMPSWWNLFLEVTGFDAHRHTLPEPFVGEDAGAAR